MLLFHGNPTTMPDLDHSAPVALDDFLRRVEPRLKRLLASYRIPVVDAEDLVQQALLALLYQWETVRDPECWLLGTLKRRCLMYWRGHRRSLYKSVDAALLDWLAAPMAAPQERADLLADLENLICKLPERCRSLLRLRFHLGYEPSEVAAKLGYRASSIGKITTRCLAALNRELLASGMGDRRGNLAGLSSPEPRSAERR
jgi:RNA polymerase sigma factor (sigma-70 family)